MSTSAATVDFSVANGRLRRRLHSSGFMPNISMQNINDFREPFSEMHFLEARTHDQALVNPGQRVVDTHFIFPNMKDDPADPESYYFAATDHLLETCLGCGTKIMYRLGTSIEHTRDRHFNALMPEDFEKYAEVLAGIVRHYNDGWANGFHWGIEYWEIWNEADLGPQMWDGSLEDYHRFYGIVARRLKSEFPDIKVGGPAFCGLKSDLFSDWLTYCRANDAPVDFISWHCYTADVDKLVAQPQRARELFDSLGYKNAEIMINEWHYILSWEGVHHNFTPEGYERAMSGPTGMFGIDSAAFNVSVVARWHDTPLDAAYYYGCGEETWGFVTCYKALNKNYYSMYLLGQMMTGFPNRVEAAVSGETLSVLAGGDDDGNRAILLADYRGDDLEIPVTVAGAGTIRGIEVSLLDQQSNLKRVEPARDGDRLILRKDASGSAVFYVTFHSAGV